MAKILSFTAAVARSRQPPQAHPPHTNPVELWLRRRKPGASRIGAAGHANAAARHLGYADYHVCPWHTLTYTDIAALRASLLALVEDDTYVPATANHYLMAAKGIMAEVWRLGVETKAGYLDADTLALIESEPLIPGRRRRRPRRVLTDAEAVTLLAHCAADLTPRGARDAALVAVALACGLRASEHAALQIDDYDREGRRLRVPQIKVEISQDDVWLPFGPPASDYLDRWLAWRGAEPGVIFTRLERGGLGLIGEMRPESITIIIKERAEDCKMGRVTAHDLRSTFVTRILRHTGDLAMAARLARHLKVETTSLYYDKRDLADMRETMTRVPWPGKADDHQE